MVKSQLPEGVVKPDSATVKAQLSKMGNEVIARPELQPVNELKGRASKYRNEAKRYAKNDSVSRAELKRKAEAMAQNRLMNFKELRALEQQKKSMGRLRSSQDQYKEQANELQDTTYLKEQARKKAEEAAMAYITKNPGVMNAVQKRMNSLMKVYSIVPNSNDLSTAVKRSSLEGRSFKERLFLGGNFQVISLKPVSIEVSPTIGYRITNSLIAGVGINYRKTFDDTLSQIASNMIGYKGFVSYDVVLNFFAYSEYSINNDLAKHIETSPERTWNSVLLLGVGRKIALHPRLDMTAVILYNLTHKSDNLVYAGRWTFRIGFQTSALGFLKKKPDFNPRQAR